MNRADWIGRALCLAITFGVARGQLALFAPENTLASVAINQVLSAFSNTCALLAAAAFVRGKASFDLQRLAYCAIVVNFLGFVAYSAKISPLIHALNGVITVISYAQLLRILWPSNGDPVYNSRRFGVFYFAAFQSPGLRVEEKK
jgi:phosphoglycerol transferase MdoB-like AlkP superfamily enzyme